MRTNRLLCIVLTLTLFVGCNTTEESPSPSPTSPAESSRSESSAEEPAATRLDINVGGLKGPTGMALAYLKSTSESGEATHNYNVTFDAGPDVIQAKLLSGEIDIGAVPTNVASALYNKTEGEVRIIAVSRLNVLYILAAPGVEVSSLEDLRGKTLFTAGQGATQEYVLSYLLNAAGIDPETDLTIEYKSEHAEVVTLLLDGQCDIALLPQPHATTATMKNEEITRVIDINEEWQKQNGEVEMAMSCIVARSAFIEEHPEVIDDFLADYTASAAYTLEHTAEAAALIGGYEIVPEAVANLAIPNSSIACVTGDEMKTAVMAYLNILHEQAPQSVGGALPDESLFYPA